MTALYYSLLAVYSFVLLYITLYCIMQFQLLYHYSRYKNRRGNSVGSMNGPEDLPYVTVQLPVFNELHVVERLIERICEFDYPTDRIEIQVLDDSTDETKEIVKRKVEFFQGKGIQIRHIQREIRTGFKAGALYDALPLAKGEFIAIFDADFLPHADFLLKTIPYFQDERVGVVQTRWEHINQNYSLITQLQALQLNAHFTVEQAGREAGDYMLQFNGTAGIWRRNAIEDAGGWQADTLTEDLDLSYRAQLKGWKIIYLEEVGSPAELPVEMNGFKSQQFRWMKGGAETARKILPIVWGSDLSLNQKLQATVHLLGSTIFVFVFMLGVLSVPLMIALQKLHIGSEVFSFFLIGTLSIMSVYFVANVSNEFTHTGDTLFKRMMKFVVMFPIFIAMTMGLSFHNSVAVLQGYRGRKSPFVRTPKFDIQRLTDSFRKSKYYRSPLRWTTFFEGVLCVYFMGAILLGYKLDDTSMIIFHLLLALGYGSIFYLSLKHLSFK